MIPETNSSVSLTAAQLTSNSIILTLFRAQAGTLVFVDLLCVPQYQWNQNTHQKNDGLCFLQVAKVTCTTTGSIFSCRPLCSLRIMFSLSIRLLHNADDDPLKG